MAYLEPTQIPNDEEGWRRFDFSAQDGTRLVARDYAGKDNHGLAVLCLAGLSRNSADFHKLALHLSQETNQNWRVFCPDYRGRGMSARDRNWRNYNILQEADDVIAGVNAAGIGRTVLVGTSRGGLIAFALAAMRPGLLAGVVLNDVGPEIDARGLLRIRKYLGNGARPTSWPQAAAALKSIGELQFPRFDDAEWMRQAQLIFEERNNRIVPRYDPALLKPLGEINLDLPLPTMWPQFAGLSDIPVMVIRGANSDLLSTETVERMASLHPALESVEVADQGHAPDLGHGQLPERIAAFAAKVARNSGH